ncbi:MAG: WD40 repeat domain-containing protein [Candidatus Poribacteria bacterium]|nr:WD40 repeat domain-containing protein [Candidatus Poribacteria bacterium]
MKIARSILLMSIFASILFSLNLFAQDYNKWKLPEGAKLRLGKGRVHDIKYTPDGKRVAVATSIGIWIYDAHTHEELALLTGHTSRVTAIDFPADGSFLASGSFDGTVRLWNIDTGEQTAIFAGHQGSIGNIAVSPDGKTVVSGGTWDTTIILWDIKTGKQIKRHSKYHDNLFRRLKIYFDRSRTIPDPNAIEALAFSPDGQTFASGHRDGTLRIWDAETGRKRKTIGVHNYAGIESLTYSPDGKKLVSCTRTQEILLHTFRNGKHLSSHIHYVPFPHNLVFSPDGNNLFGIGYMGQDTVGQQPYIHKWNVNTGGLLMSTPTPYTYQITSLTGSPDGSTLLNGGWGDTIVSWNPETLEHSIFTTGHATVGRTLQFSPDGKMLNTISGKDNLKFLDTETGAEISAPQQKSNSTKQKPKTSQRRVSAEYIKKRTAIRIYDVETGTDMYHITEHKDIIWRYSFSPDRKTLATASKDMTIRLWEVSTGKELLMIPTYSGWPTTITFSPDGKTLAGGGVYDREQRSLSLIHVWEVPSGRILKKLPGHIDGIESLRFSPDGKTLASSGGGVILLWDWEKILQSTR